MHQPDGSAEEANWHATGAADAGPASSILEKVGRYKILELIGEGAMAEVYKAHDPQIDRPLALKILKPERCLDEEYLSRFLREAKAAGALSHSNIITVHDVGQIDNRPYIVMELIEGMSLGDSVEPGSPMPVRKILSVGIQLADALEYAHEHGVIHRDVKPSNIMLLPDEQTIKIADFGIAHIEDPNAQQQTQVGTVLGTPQYMSPEQVMGHEVDGRSDLFSVGVILYQLCTGQKPFDADTMATLLFSITQEEPQPLSEVAPELPDGLKHIVTKLLAKTPASRFQSGKDLARALRHELRILEDQAADAGKRGIVPIRVRWTLLSALIVALVMGISIYFVERKQQEILLSFAVDSGVSAAKFVANETAVRVLGKEWVAIEIFVNEAVGGKTFKYLRVLDHQNVVRGADEAQLLGQAFEQPSDFEPLLSVDGVHVTRSLAVKEAPVLGFDAPILFQGKEVGRVHVGLEQSPLQEVVGTTRVMLYALGIITVLTVALMSYVLAELLARPIRTLRASLQEIRKGNFDCRISQQRKDELGQVFEEFNKMAASLEKDDEPILPKQT